LIKLLNRYCMNAKRTVSDWFQCFPLGQYYMFFIPILSTHFSHTCATQQPILSCHLGA
jgi:hypothetical protein